MLKMLEHLGVPLHTDALENDLLPFVAKRKISGASMSRDGRVARDIMLGLVKTLNVKPEINLAISRQENHSLELVLPMPPTS